MLGDWAVEIIGILVASLLSLCGVGLKMAHSKAAAAHNRAEEVHGVLTARIEVLDQKKADHEDMREIKSDVKQILDELKKFQVETAKWQGQAEGRGLTKHEKS